MFEAALSGLYCGPAAVPGNLWLRWNLDPVLLAALAGLGIMLRRSAAGRLALAALIAAFISPLCALSGALFSARVIHHLLLVAVAAPLLAMAVPLHPILSPVTGLVLSTLVLWLWHLPAAYDLAMANMGIYWIMQLTLLGSALAFWKSVLDPTAPPGTALLSVVAAYVQMGMLGALLTFAPAALYGIHQTAPPGWGLTPLADQQLGGLIMWVPAALLYGLWGARVARSGWRGLHGRPA